MAMPNPLVAVITLMKADAAIIAQVATRVFGEELPRSEVGSMPRKAITLHSNGGRYDQDDLIVSPYRINTHCYGATVYEALQVDLVVYEFFKNLKRRGIATGGGVLLANAETGPFTLRDPDTTWPYVLTTYRCLVSEIANA
jgi:hypothetical protein